MAGKLGRVVELHHVQLLHVAQLLFRVTLEKKWGIEKYLLVTYSKHVEVTYRNKLHIENMLRLLIFLCIFYKYVGQSKLAIAEIYLPNLVKFWSCLLPKL